MSFPIGNYSLNNGNGNGQAPGQQQTMTAPAISGTGVTKANSNPTSVDAMYYGILPGTSAGNSASPANPRQHLSGLNLGSMTGAVGTAAAAATTGGVLGQLGGSHTATHNVHHGVDPTSTAAAAHHQLSSLQSGLSEEIKRLQQLHQLTSSVSNAHQNQVRRHSQQLSALHHNPTGTGGNGTGTGAASAPAAANHLMQNFLAAQAATASAAAAGTAAAAGGGGVATHRGSLTPRDAATYLLMSQQQQQQQQQALQKQQQQTQALQQQHLLQQRLGAASASAGGRLAAQLMAMGAAGQPTGGSSNAMGMMGLGGGSNMAGGGIHHHHHLLPSPSMLSARTSSAMAAIGRPGPGAIEPFPEKLHRMLTEVEMTGKSHIISFVDKGRAFAIHKPNQFFQEVIPLYFRQSRLSSFKRQLNLYGFELISNGPSRGSYFHDLFQKDKPTLCRRMRRVAVKVAAKKQQEEETQAATQGKATEEG